MQIKWTKKAISNLEKEFEYIAKDNPEAAEKIAKQIKETVEKLKTYKLIGRPGRFSSIRELVIPKLPYIIPYRIKKDTIEIIRILHTARKTPKNI